MILLTHYSALMMATPRARLVATPPRMAQLQVASVAPLEGRAELAHREELVLASVAAFSAVSAAEHLAELVLAFSAALEVFLVAMVELAATLVLASLAVSPALSVEPVDSVDREELEATFRGRETLLVPSWAALRLALTEQLDSEETLPEPDTLLVTSLPASWAMLEPMLRQ
jgi:hypothetical protein